MSSTRICAEAEACDTLLSLGKGCVQALEQQATDAREPMPRETRHVCRGLYTVQMVLISRVLVPETPAAGRRVGAPPV